MLLLKIRNSNWTGNPSDNEKFIISIDAGTTSNRSILFDLKGKPVFFFSKRIYTIFSKKWLGRT